MRDLAGIFILLVSLIFNVPCHSVERSKRFEIQNFQERCTELPITHSQASWHCTGRLYLSAIQLISDLKQRSNHEEWRVADSDIAFNKLQNREIWWDCIPNEGGCGYWVKMGPEQFIFLQQVLDTANNNAWLGVGITTFCGGPKPACDELLRTAENILDEHADFSEGRTRIGPAPSPPMPPENYRPAP